MFLAVLLSLYGCIDQSEIRLPFVETMTTSPSATSTSITETAILNVECMNSFDDFAYSVPDWDRSVKTKKVPPLEPWQAEIALPDLTKPDIGSSASVEITRSVGSRNEIWIERETYNVNGDKDTYEFIIYWPDTKEWKIISAEIGDTGVYVDRLYLTSDGSIWGRNYWDPFSNINVDKTPVLSIYDESIERFEFVQEALKVPVIENDINIISFPHEVLLDEHGVFWIFIQKDGLYSYNPNTHEIRQEAKISDVFVKQAVLAPEGSIYIANYLSKVNYKLQREDLSQFIPELGEINLLDIPSEPWPRFSKIFIDHTGRLWLDAIGWREPDGTWHLMHPDAEVRINQIKSGSGYHTTPPSAFFEGSNGVLWFRRGTDIDIIFDGTAWFDPKTGEGCRFTTEYTNIVEDSRQNLWLVADGKLYKYDLNP